MLSTYMEPFGTGPPGKDTKGSKTGPANQPQSTGPVLDPFRTGSRRAVPCTIRSDFRTGSTYTVDLFGTSPM